MIILKTDDINSQIYQDALAIRKQVFVAEQNIPETIEISEENQAVYFVCYNHLKQPLGTCRIKLVANNTYKIQRFAVLKSARKQHIGTHLLEAVESYAKSKHVTAIKLEAQCSAQGFYERCHYNPTSDIFYEAGIPHQEMKKELV